MTGLVNARLVPVGVILDGRIGLAVWAPSYVDHEGAEVQGFVGGAHSIQLFSDADDLSGYLRGSTTDALSDHPRWRSLARRSPDELRARPDDIVDLDGVFAAATPEPTPAGAATISRAVQFAKAVAEVFDDEQLIDVLDRPVYAVPDTYGGRITRRGDQRWWDALVDELVESWQWVLDRLDNYLLWTPGNGPTDVDGVVRSTDRLDEPLWNMPRAGQGDVANTDFGSEWAADLPGRGLTIAITILFGFFGVIPAALHTSRARALGVRTGRYWNAFAWSLLVSFAGVVLLVSAAAAALAGSS